MRDALRVGLAIYNDGFYHAAHDAWESPWLSLEDGTDDERLLHGLIQYTAAIYHARNRNWEGATGLAGSAEEYLRGLPHTLHGVDLKPVRHYLEKIADDPELIERREPPQVTHEGDVPTLADLTVEQIGTAAVILAEEWGYTQKPLEQAAEYARTDFEGGDAGSQFISLLFDFVLEEDRRGLVYQRLGQHVDRRETRESDVEGLF